MERHADRIREYTTLLAFAKTFGYTPDQVRALKPRDRIAFTSLMAGEAQAKK